MVRIVWTNQILLPLLCVCCVSLDALLEFGVDVNATEAVCLFAVFRCVTVFYCEFWMRYCTVHTALNVCTCVDIRSITTRLHYTKPVGGDTRKCIID